MKKKMLIVFLVVVAVCVGLGFMILSQKNGTPTLSGVHKVDQAADTAKDNGENIFKGTKNTLGYSFVAYKNPATYMILPYPSGWKVESKSDNHIKFTAPYDDPLLPDVSINVFYCLNTYNDTSDIQDQTSLFETKLLSCKSYINGNWYTRAKSVTPDKYDTKVDYIKNDKAVVNVATFNDLKVEGDSGKYETGMYGRDCYVSWAGIPCVFTTSTDPSRKEKVNTLLDYMISNITYTKQEISSVGTIKPLGDELGLTFSIPNKFKEVSASVPQGFKQAETYQCEPNSQTGFSGMSISVYSFDYSSYSILENFDSGLADELFSNCFAVSSSDYYNMYSTTRADSKDMAGLSTDVLNTTITVMQKNNNGYEFIEHGDTVQMETFALNDKKTVNLIVFTYPESQSELAKSISEKIKTSIKRGNK